MRPERFGLLALLVVTVIWGTTFPAMKLLSQWLGALQIIWLRVAIALAGLAPPGGGGGGRYRGRGGGGGGAGGVWVGILGGGRCWGCALGLLLFLAFWLQIEGLARTSSNRNAFVT